MVLAPERGAGRRRQGDLLELDGRAVRRLAQTFFGGSLPQMMTELMAEESWTDAELDAIQDEINRARKERKQQS